MKILVVGGGVFVGRALIETAVAAGHTVTAFSRGNSPLPCADQIEHLTGDRDAPADLAQLNGGAWDAVIDTCAYRPAAVTTLHAALGGRGGRFCLISSISAYADFPIAGAREDTPLAASIDQPGESITPANYGPLKADCERAALHAFSDPLVIRPGIIAGPHDPTDRFTYWVNLVCQSSRLVVPETLPDQAIQLIDARDLAAWIIRLLEASVSGTFNAVGPREPTTMARLLAEIADTFSRPPPRFIAQSPAALEHLGAVPANAFPLYLAPTTPGLPFGVDGRRAWAAGLTLRPLTTTARDTAAWFAAQHPAPLKVGWPAAAMAAASAKLDDAAI